MLQIITTREETKAIFFEYLQWAAENQPAGPVASKPEIMTGEQLCEKLDITIQTLIRWRQKGKVPFLQIGGSIRYDFNKVIAALEVKKKGNNA